MIFKNSKIYDFLKWVSLVMLDAVGVAYESLANVWGLPYGDEVMKTCTIISILIGALIGVSSMTYKKTAQIEEYEQEEENANEYELDEPEEE